MSKLRDSTKYRVVKRADRPNTTGVIQYLAHDVDIERVLESGPYPGLERKRAYPGDIVDDLPRCSVAGLLADGAIVKAGSPEDPYGPLPASAAAATAPSASTASKAPGPVTRPVQPPPRGSGKPR